MGLFGWTKGEVEIVMDTLRRFFIESILPEKDGSCTLTGTEARHITKVLRMGTGDRLILVDGQGNRFQACILSSGKGTARVRIEKTVPTPEPSPVEMTICQALIKSRPMDLVIQKCSELGVTCIIPFNSDRTIIKLDKTRVASKTRHWKEIARSSTKQADRDKPPRVADITSFAHCLDEDGGEGILKVILWEEEGALDLKACLKSSTLVKKFRGIVGPEGGFTHEEVRLAEAKGFTPVSLGRRILRAETAAIALAAIVQYECGDLGIAVP
jgi:16S rRNA (uracil1498-N3)-methyltransferase